ncbi:MAG: MarR family winged helix-turn-helix transcriptional regulator [Halioglobus sp.]
MPQFAPYEMGQTLYLLQQDFQKRLDRVLERGGFAGIRSRHRAVFMHLDRHGASRSVDLAAAAGIRAQSMMKIVHELEALGLVARSTDPADSRAKLIEFTPLGQSQIEQLTRATQTVWDEYAVLAGEDVLDTTFQSLQALLNISQEQS